MTEADRRDALLPGMGALVAGARHARRRRTVRRQRGAGQRGQCGSGLARSPVGWPPHDVQSRRTALFDDRSTVASDPDADLRFWNPA
jgi:hypothetical protein